MSIVKKRKEKKGVNKKTKLQNCFIFYFFFFFFLSLFFQKNLWITI